MTAKIKKASPKKAKEPVNEDGDWNIKKQTLEHRIKALKKIIEQLSEDGKKKSNRSYQNK
jgi:hypothetical protein